MNSKEISHFIGQNVCRRKIGFLTIFLTTLREWHIRRGIDYVMKRQGKNAVALDAGFGLGQHLYRLAVRFPAAQIIGVEQDVQQVRDLAAFFGQYRFDHVRLQAVDLLQAQVPAPVDVVLCCSVLEHIEHDMEALKWFWEHMAPQGYLLLYVPTSEKRILSCLARKIARLTTAAGQKLPHGHARYYQPEELKSKLAKTGFAVVTETVTYGWAGRLSYDLVTGVQFSRFFKVLFPLYFLFLHPFVLLLMLADFFQQHERGNGYLCIAQKRSHEME